MPDSARYWKGTLPGPLMARVSELVQDHPELGYRNPTEFITDAIRRRVEEVMNRLPPPGPSPDEVERARLANRRAVERARAEDERRAREGR